MKTLKQILNEEKHSYSAHVSNGVIWGIGASKGQSKNDAVHALNSYHENAILYKHPTSKSYQNHVKDLDSLEHFSISEPAYKKVKDHGFQESRRELKIDHIQKHISLTKEK